MKTKKSKGGAVFIFYRREIQKYAGLDFAFCRHLYVVQNFRADQSIVRLTGLFKEIPLAPCSGSDKYRHVG